MSKSASAKQVQRQVEGIGEDLKSIMVRLSFLRDKSMIGSDFLLQKVEIFLGFMGLTIEEYEKFKQGLA